MVQELKAELLSGRIQKLTNPFFEQELRSKSEAPENQNSYLCPFLGLLDGFNGPRPTLEILPSQYLIMVMRKYLQGAVIGGVEQMENDRT